MSLCELKKFCLFAAGFLQQQIFAENRIKTLKSQHAKCQISWSPEPSVGSVLGCWAKEGRARGLIVRSLAGMNIPEIVTVTVTVTVIVIVTVTVTVTVEREHFNSEVKVTSDFQKVTSQYQDMHIH